MNKRLVIAADGGNSKTDLILATADGQQLARVRGEGTRHETDSAAVMAVTLLDLVAQSLHQAGLPSDTQIDLGVFFCANVDTDEEERDLRAAMTDAGVCRQLVVGTDTMAVLHAGTPDDWGVAVVAGAGINATARDRHGRTESFLSQGRCSGDFGGGGWIAMEGQAAAIRAVDGRGPATVLTQLIPEFFHMTDPFEVALAMSYERIPWTDAIKACPVVIRAAEHGDQVALSILHTHAEEVATMAQALVRRLGLGDEPVPVVLGGSVMTHGGALHTQLITDALMAHVPNAQPIFLTVSPVEGSLAYALRLIT